MEETPYVRQSLRSHSRLISPEQEQATQPPFAFAHTGGFPRPKPDRLKITRVARLRSPAPLHNESFKPTPLRGVVVTSSHPSAPASATLPQRRGLIQALARRRNRFQQRAFLPPNPKSFSVPLSPALRHISDLIHLRAVSDLLAPGNLSHPRHRANSQLQRANNSFKPTPLRGVVVTSSHPSVPASATLPQRRGLIQALGGSHAYQQTNICRYSRRWLHSAHCSINGFNHWRKKHVWANRQDAGHTGAT